MSDDVVGAFLVIGAIFVLAAAAGEATAVALRFRGITVPPIVGTRPRIFLAVLGVAILIIAGIGALTQVHTDRNPAVGPIVPSKVPSVPTPSNFVPSTTPSVTDTSSTPSASPSMSVPSDSTPSDTVTASTAVSGPGSVVRHGVLTVRAHFAIDLDSSATDWGAFRGTWADGRNFEWDGDPQWLRVAGAPDSISVPDPSGPADYDACVAAAPKGDPGGARGLRPGVRFCVQTGRHMVLLIVTAVHKASNVAPATLVLDATVWNES